MIHKNTEGYADPTAGIAMSRMMRDHRQKQKQQFSDRNEKPVINKEETRWDSQKN